MSPSADHLPIDRGENIAMLEPLRVLAGSRHHAGLVERAFALSRRSAEFRARLPDDVVRALADLVRAMNCYYSNLIEGHDTHPVDIERALHSDYSQDPKKRDLQREALAHIGVQEWIDGGGLRGRASAAEGLREIHRRFYDALPEDMRWVEDPASGERWPVEPGAWRRRDVRVGVHVPISSGALPRFMARLEDVYAGLAPAETVIAAAAAHHRMLWVHPFLDGNGRVARLMSHAALLDALDTGGVWSIARGLARRVSDYKRLLADCDQPRRNDLDGRGALSEEALATFSTFFLDTCLDQVDFMQELVRPERLRDRILFWAAEEIRVGLLPPKSERVLEAILYRGTLPRGELPALLDVGERQARRLVASLTERGVVTADSSRAPLRLVFPARLAARWLPGLFPDKS